MRVAFKGKLDLLSITATETKLLGFTFLNVFSFNFYVAKERTVYCTMTS